MVEGMGGHGLPVRDQASVTDERQTDRTSMTVVLNM